MRGQIIKRGKKKSSYAVVVSLGKDADGKYKRLWVSVKGTRKDAERRLAEVLHQIDTGLFVQPGKSTVGEYLQRWLKDCGPRLKSRTAAGYESIVRCHITPKLGSIPLSQLKPAHIQAYYADMLAAGRCGGGALSSTTVRQHHMILHRALRVAVKLGLLARNPADAVEPPRSRHTDMRVLDESGIESLLAAARQTDYYAIFHLALYTGMRRSELLALRWGDVDLVLGQISVTRSLHRLQGGAIVFQPPKTAKGRRTIALPPSATLMLSEHRSQQELLAGTPSHDDQLVFSHPDGAPIQPDAVSQAWRRLAQRCGLGGVRLHDARHSHATLMLKLGVHPKIVQERLGHSTIAMTLDTYSHVAPGLQEAAAASFDAAVRRAPAASDSKLIAKC